MKNNYFFVSILFFLYSFSASSQDYTSQVDYYFQHLDKSQIPTGILYERVFPAADLKSFTDNEIDTTSSVHFLTAFAELQTADYSGRWQPASAILNNLADKPAWEVSVGAIHIDFNTLDERAIVDNLLNITNYMGDSLLVDVPGRSRSPYLLHTITLASPLQLYSNSLNPGFY